MPVHTQYDNLKVARNATPEVIRAAYRVLAQRYHPDKNSSPDAVRVMKLLNEAFAVLSDPQSRAEHDAWIDEQNALEASETAKGRSKHDEPPDRAHATHPQAKAATRAPEKGPPHVDVPQPPPTGNERANPSIHARPAGPWRRFLARSIDVWLTAFAVGFAGAVAIHMVWPAKAALIDSGVGALVFGLVTVFVAMHLDGFIYGLFGNTPGKALFGLFVTDAAGKPLGQDSYAQRSFEVWIAGLACGLPIIGLFTMAAQHTKLTKRGSAGYDAGRYAVWARPSGWVQDTMAVVAIAGLLLAQLIVSRIAEAALDTETAVVNRPHQEPATQTTSTSTHTPIPAPPTAEAQTALTAMQRVAADAKARFPQLDPNSGKTDAAAINYVISERDTLIEGGVAQHEALQIAVDKAARRFNWVRTGQDTAAPTRGDAIYRCKDAKGQAVYTTERCGAVVR